MQHRIISETEVARYDFIKLVKAEVEVETFRGDKEVITRYGLIRPEVVAAILYRRDLDKLIMVEQFRYSALRTGNGWVKEIVAGIVENDEDITIAAKRECLEEAGYQVNNDFRKVLEFYPSVGLSNQLIHLYYGEVTSKNRVSSGGGLEEEQEDLKVHEIKSSEVYQDLLLGKYLDGKALIGLLWFFQNIKKNINDHSQLPLDDNG